MTPDCLDDQIAKLVQVDLLCYNGSQKCVNHFS